LHLDPCEAYGGEWGVLAPDTGADGSSTFGWRLPPTPATPPSPSPSPPPSSPSPGEILLPALGAPARAFGPASRFSSSRGSIAPGGDLALAPNRFILDLAAGAKLATCASDPLVDALVASGAHKYVEFRSIARTWMYWDGAFAPVPASRAEVFRDATMAPGEKRALMRTLKDAVARAEAAGVAIGTGDPDDANRAIGAPGSEWKSATEKKDPAATTGPSVEEIPEPKRERRSNDASSFAEDLASRGLSPRVAAATQYALALCDDASADAATGHDRLARYLASIGRYGPAHGALLAPQYGAGELPQAFARSAAVAGAVYALGVGVRSILLDPEGGEEEGGGEEGGIPGRRRPRVSGVLTAGGQRLRCRALAVSADAWPDAIGRSADARAADRPLGTASPPTLYVSRATWIVDGPVTPGDEDEKSPGPDRVSPELVVFPPGTLPSRATGKTSGKTSGDHFATRVIQLGASSGTCPSGVFVLHASVASADPEGDPEAELRDALAALVDDDDDAEDDRSSGRSTRTFTVGEEEAKPRGKGKETTRKPRLLWGAYYRRESQGAWEETSEGTTSEGAWTVGGLANAVRCPGPDAGIAFDGAVRAAEAARAALARAWGDDETDRPDLFPAAASGTAGEDEGAGGGDADEDEMDALLRNLPGGAGT